MYFVHKRSFNQEYDISIIDDIRNDLIAELRGKEKEKELIKINKLPHRKKNETRKQNSDEILGQIWLMKELPKA